MGGPGGSGRVGVLEYGDLEGGSRCHSIDLLPKL